MTSVASRTVDPANRASLPAVVLLGAPGTGKGTQGAILDAVPGFWFVSMGQVLRDKISDQPADATVHESMQAGKLVSEESVFEAWERHLKKLKQAGFSSKDGTLVIDGLPRNIAQAKRLQQYVDVLRIIYLRCTDDDLLMQRIRGRAAGAESSAQRADDASVQVTRHRLRVFREQTLPLLDWFPRQRISIVDAALQPLEVVGQVVDELLKHRILPGATDANLSTSVKTTDS